MVRIESVSFFMEECRRSDIKVLGPCVNESGYRFTVNNKGQIRFGMGGMKGVGAAAVMSIKKEREENLLELANEKSRLNTIVKSINDGVVVINRTGEIVYFNNATLKNLDIADLNIGDKANEKLPDTIIEHVNKYFESESIDM